MEPPYREITMVATEIRAQTSPRDARQEEVGVQFIIELYQSKATLLVNRYWWFPIHHIMADIKEKFRFCFHFV